jgi:GDP/UDP-N,N'-diacetylbacillosamine 2-epimerase (hydrolysing)
MSKQKILAVTGIRSEYDILYPVLCELQQDPFFELKVVVTGAHLSNWHGDTYAKVEADGFEVADRIDYLLMTNRNTQRSKGVGALIVGLTQTVEREQPDIILFVGDREESIACCVVGNYMDVKVAHIGGGDTVYGNADDPIRFACSDLAHIHFTTSQQYADNLLKIGEEPFRICFSGNPALKNISDTVELTQEAVSDYLDFELDKYIVLLKHPLSSSKDESYNQMKVTLDSVEKFVLESGYKFIGIYPNTDPGSYDIVNAIEECESENIKFFKNLPRDIFVNIMRRASALIGNSSMGILEAPFYKIPVVNVGDRQKGRLNAGNVEFVGYDQEIIVSALLKAVENKDYVNFVKGLDCPYGDGSGSKKIVSYLKTMDEGHPWLIKKKLF